MDNKKVVLRGRPRPPQQSQVMAHILPSLAGMAAAAVSRDMSPTVGDGSGGGTSTAKSRGSGRKSLSLIARLDQLDVEVGALTFNDKPGAVLELKTGRDTYVLLKMWLLTHAEELTGFSAVDLTGVADSEVATLSPVLRILRKDLFVRAYFLDPEHHARE